MTDHRSNPRRRGQELETAILEATIAELAEVGYAGLTMDAVAARAKAGKVSIYRRWPTKAALVMAAGYQYTRGAQVPPDTGSLRQDTFTWLRGFADQLEGPVGQALLGAVVDSANSEQPGELAKLSEGRGRQVAELLVQRARNRGEPVVAGLTDVQLSAPSNALKLYYFIHGGRVDDSVLWAIVEELAMPLWRAESRGC